MKISLILKSSALAFIFLYSNYAMAMDPAIAIKTTSEAALIAGSAIAPIVVVQG